MNRPPANQIRCLLGRMSALLVSIALAGCGQSGPDRYQVFGTIEHNGSPVPTGYIVFEPDTSKGNSGPGAAAAINDGRYATPRGKGIVGGPYIVRIHGSDGIPVELPGEGIEPNGTPLFTDHLEYVDFPHGDSEQDFIVTHVGQ